MIDTRDKLRQRARLMTELLGALERRQSLNWGDGERKTYTRVLAELGVELVTHTAAKRGGLVVKQRQTPVARAYFGAPLQRYGDLFIAGIQTRPREEG